MLDFSLALSRSNLATALVYNNPIEEKLLQDTVTCLDKMRRRRMDQRYQDQRRFFVRQVFDKGLTPYVPPRQTGGVGGATGGGGASGGGGVTNGVAGSSGIVADRVLITDPVESTGDKTGRRNAPKRADSPPYERSKTFCDIRLRKGDKTGSKNTTASGLEAEKTDKVFQADRRTTRDVVGEGGRGGGETGLAPAEKPPRRLKPVRRDLRSLKKDPSMLFPRMNTLIVEGYESHRIDSLTPKQHDHRDHDDHVDLHNGKKHATSNEKAGLHPGKGDELSKQIKLVQKLTSSLPDHLMASAQKQIRQMSNSDAIYECKDKLLEENKGELLRQVGLDPRWRQLHGSLSTTHGIGLKWKKSTMDGSWTVSKE